LNIEHARVSFPAGSLAWASDPVKPAGSSPATLAKLDPAQKKKNKKYMISLRIFLLNFA